MIPLSSLKLVIITEAQAASSFSAYFAISLSLRLKALELLTAEGATARQRVRREILALKSARPCLYWFITFFTGSWQRILP
jgi:hypothetical protein